MREYEFLLNINNEEILIEILHHAVDVLIGICNEEHTLNLCQKFNFSNTDDDFNRTIRALTQYYRNVSEDSTPLLTEQQADVFNFNSELQDLAKSVYNARRKEINDFLLNEYNASIHPLVEYFDWDVRLILGDSNYPENRQTITTLTFQLYDSTKGTKRPLHMQLNSKMLDAFINSIEMALKEPEESSMASTSNTQIPEAKSELSN